MRPSIRGEEGLGRTLVGYEGVRVIVSGLRVMARSSMTRFHILLINEVAEVMFQAAIYVKIDLKTKAS